MIIKNEAMVGKYARHIKQHTPSPCETKGQQDM